MAESTHYKENSDQFQRWASKQTKLHLTNGSETSILTGELPSHAGYKEPTIAQLTLFLLWLTVIILWLLRVPFRKTQATKGEEQDVEAQTNGPVRINHDKSTNSSEISKEGKETSMNGPVLEKIEKAIINAEKENVEMEQENISAKNLTEKDESKPEKKAEDSKNKNASKERAAFTSFKPPPSFDQFLYYLIIFGGIMFYFYLCDYQHIFRQESGSIPGISFCSCY
ncbi:uncharacterized protein [Ptychodera flava]|uniref:uncharacterized protein isoform X2 n=1 Tax=Ptychodera flava TaxID=63121 RepID=UPI00396A1AE2